MNEVKIIPSMSVNRQALIEHCEGCDWATARTGQDGWAALRDQMIADGEEIIRLESQLSAGAERERLLVSALQFYASRLADITCIRHAARHGDQRARFEVRRGNADHRRGDVKNDIDDGGPAYPIPIAGCNDGGVYNTLEQSAGKLGGMTLRDYFAAKATDADLKDFLPYGATTATPRERATARYKFADAMLAARKAAP